MQQTEKAGLPAPGEKAEQISTGPADAEKTPGAIRPRCVSRFCVARREKGEKRSDGSLVGDPLKIYRLRYDFPDGVVAETLFCADCRAMINATLVGIDSSIVKRNAKAAAAVVPDPPKS